MEDELHIERGETITWVRGSLANTDIEYKVLRTIKNDGIDQFYRVQGPLGGITEFDADWIRKIGGRYYYFSKSRIISNMEDFLKEFAVDESQPRDKRLYVLQLLDMSRQQLPTEDQDFDKAIKEIW